MHMSNNKAQGALVLSAIGQLQRLSDAFGRRRVQLARRVGLTEQQWRVLEEISSEHFIPSMFARENDSSAAAVSKVLRQLLDKELVVVSVSQADGRQRAYELSDRGRAVMDELRSDREEAIRTIWADLSPDELTRFCAFAEILTERIERYASRQTGEAKE